MRITAIALWALMLSAPPARAGEGDRTSAPPPFAAGASQADSIRFAARAPDEDYINLMGVTVTNYGFVGNNFVSRTPSMEYPLGTGYEHMVRGGLWIGARTFSDPNDSVDVVTGAVDGSQGSSAQQATEFTPAGREIQWRSTLLGSDHFDRRAVSEQDYVSEFSDRPAKRSANNSEDHRPMNILVRQENYAWSFSDYQHLVIFHFVIKNLGTVLDSVWVGFYAELASGPKNSYSSWPPSSGGSSIGGWYNKKWLQYDDSLCFIREHYCAAGNAVPSSCVLERVPEWVGIKLLGTGPTPLADLDTTLAAWTWSPGDTLRDEDTERYRIMSAGTHQDLSASDLQPQSGDPIVLLATGPFTTFNLGDSLVVDFALVGGFGLIDASEAQEHSRFAQRAFDRGYKIPVPPQSPRLKVVARDQALDLYWDSFRESEPDSTGPLPLDFEGYRVYLSEDRRDLQAKPPGRLIGQFDLAVAPHDTTGFNTGFGRVQVDTTTLDGEKYVYRLHVPGLKNGFKYYCAVTAYDLGNTEVGSLESGTAQNETMAIPGPALGERSERKVYVYPNPYRVEAQWDRARQVRDHYLWFTNLPARCTLRIYTLSGDLVFQTDPPFTGATYHGEGTRGVYDPANPGGLAPPTLSGTTFAWNMITREGQAAATGLYLFSVENRITHEKTVGKFLIVKSDREGFQ